jgi:hypothetical protein
LAEENCPYCGVSVRTPALEGVGQQFAPPYLMTNANRSQQIPDSPYAVSTSTSGDSSRPEKENEEEHAPEESLPTHEFRSVFTPLFLLLSGSVFFLFGIILAIFSRNGVFTLSWNGNLWYFYLLLSLPLLIFGWLAMQKIKEP